MADFPLVTIVIPCYNTEKYVAQAIQSSLDQTYPNIEIIVVNDGSTDNSKNILKEFKSQIIVLTQENKGLSAARNTGIKYAKGEYIMLLDADDWLNTKAVESRVNIAVKDKNIGAVLGAFIVTDQYEKKIFTSYKMKILEKNSHQLWNLLIYGAAKVDPLYKSSILLQVGLYDEKLERVEDYDILLKLTKISKLAYDPNPFAYYRDTPGSLSKNIFETFKCLDQVLKNNADGSLKYIFLSLLPKIKNIKPLVRSLIKGTTSKEQIKTLSLINRFFIKIYLFLYFFDPLVKKIKKKSITLTFYLFLQYFF